ncbi:MAG TPA: DNA/RNA nuclease SfsA [Limnochordales bacterium]
MRERTGDPSLAAGGAEPEPSPGPAPRPRARCAYVPFPPGLVPVHLIARRNRFTVEATLAARRRGQGRGTGPASRERSAEARPILRLHLPNSGRMTELLEPGALGLAALEPAAKPAGGETGEAHVQLAAELGGSARRTAGTLLLVRYAGRWVSVDARMPNRLFARCLAENCLPPFRGYTAWRAEVRWGRSRVDFLLEAPDRPLCLVETKSCNLVEDGLALFPDAPTTRGTRHLMELAEAVQKGLRAAVVWFVQRDDATALAAHRVADPGFAQALAEARAAGVEAYAYRCRVTPDGVWVLGPIPVRD